MENKKSCKSNSSIYYGFESFEEANKFAMEKNSPLVKIRIEASRPECVYVEGPIDEPFNINEIIREMGEDCVLLDQAYIKDRYTDEDEFEKANEWTQRLKRFEKANKHVKMLDEDMVGTQPFKPFKYNNFEIGVEIKGNS